MRLNRFIPLAFLLVPLLGHAQASPAQATDKGQPMTAKPGRSRLAARVDSVLTRLVPAQGPGCVVLIAEQDRVLYQRARSMASIELGVPMQTSMVFDLGSITKQFTAVAVLRLMQQGRLRLTDSIQQFIPGYPSKGHTITVEHLLTHTSGIPDFTQIDYGLRNMERWEWRPGEIIDSFKHRNLQFIPGSQYRYSNSGYFLLGVIIEQLSGRPYQQYIRDSLLLPAGLANTGFDSGDRLINGRVNGYKRLGDHPVAADYWSPSIGYAAGGLLGSAPDLLRWQRYLLTGKLITLHTLSLAWKPFTLGDGRKSPYGYGWYLGSLNGQERIFHGGVTSGFRTEVQYFPSSERTLIVLCNSDDAPKNELTERIAELLTRY